MNVSHKEPWECSNLGVVMRIAARLSPRNAKRENRPLPPQLPLLSACGQDDDDVGAAPQQNRSSCELCSDFSVLPVERLLVVCSLPRDRCDNRGHRYVCQPLGDVLGAIKDDHRDPFEPSEDGMLPVEIGCGGEGRVLLGSFHHKPVALKVLRVATGSSRPDRRMRALHSEASVGALVSRLQNSSAPGAASLSRQLGVSVTCEGSHKPSMRQPSTRSHTVVLTQRFYYLGSLDRLVHRRRRLQGVTRSGALPQNPLLTSTECLAVLVSTCKALHLLHDVVQVVHRDVKPANMFLSLAGEGTAIPTPSTDGAATVVLGDLGLSREASAVRTTCGTPKFMAPELVIPTATFSSVRSSAAASGGGSSSGGAAAGSRRKEAPYGPPVDVFGLGVSLQYAISGGAVDALRKQWKFPLHNNGSAAGGQQQSPRKSVMRSGVDTFEVPKSWCCFGKRHCECGQLHESLIKLINRMVEPNPALRPSAQEILKESSSWNYDRAVNVHAKVRDLMWNVPSTTPVADLDCLTTTVDGKGNVSSVSCPTIKISAEDMAALLPARDALQAAVDGERITMQRAQQPPPPPQPVVGYSTTVVVSAASTFSGSAAALALPPPVPPLSRRQSLAGKGFEDYIAYFTPRGAATANVLG